MINFTINVVPRTKKNSNKIVYPKGRKKPIIIPSDLYKNYEYECIMKIPQKYKIRINYPVNIKAIYYVKRNARIDKTNLEEALLDMLVKANVLADDSAIKPAVVVSTDGSRVYVDKDNPRIEIEITEADEKRMGVQ